MKVSLVDGEHRHGIGCCRRSSSPTGLVQRNTEREKIDVHHGNQCHQKIGDPDHVAPQPEFGWTLARRA